MIKINLSEEKLRAIKTTKVYYKNKIASETDKEKILIYEAMIEDLNELEQKSLAEENILLDELEKGE